jgi:hypothetical protein
MARMAEAGGPMKTTFCVLKRLDKGFTPPCGKGLQRWHSQREIHIRDGWPIMLSRCIAQKTNLSACLVRNLDDFVHLQVAFT